MKKLKLLLAACALLGAGQTWAQTDVTSTYITNPSFEYSAAGTKSSAQALTSGGTYYGWTLPALGFSYVNISIGDASNCNGQAFGIPKAKEGSYYYYERRGWNNSTSADATMSTTMTSLPVGHYTLTMAYKGLDSWDESHNSKGSYLKLSAVESEQELGLQQTATFDAVKGNSAGSEMFTGDANWKEVTLTFDVTTAGDVTFIITHHLVGGVRTDVAIDNITLTYTDPNAAANAAKLEAAKYSLNGYIKKATALNGVLSDATLTTAIETAQGVYDAADDYAEDYDNTVNAATTLNSAITTAVSSTTAVALVNGNFDTTPNNTLSGEETVFGGTLSTATSNPDNTKDFSANTGDHAYLYEVSGWTQYSKFNSTASQGTTSEYGTAMPANGWSTNSTTPPATDMFGGSTGAALHLSAGWNDQARYQQTVASLPSGRYVLYYEVINQHSNTGIASNYIGVNGAAGDFYGTSNSFVYSGLNSIEQGVWKAQAFEFDVAKTADINFSVGVTTSTGGSGNGAKLWIDNVLVYRIGDVIVTDADATAIITEVEALDEAVYNSTDKSTLATAKSTFESNKTLDNYNALNTALVSAQNSVNVYKQLDAAITKVEGWTTDATNVTNPIRSKYTNGEYANDVTTNDIFEEYQSSEVTALAVASATDYTSVILNASFETGDMIGWSAESRSDTGVKQQSNSTYAITSGASVDGSYLFNSWGGTAENNVYQTIKNLPAGTYTLSALVAGHNGESLVLAANNETATVTVIGDKTVGYTANVVFTLDAAADVIIKASNTKSQDGSDASFIKADNFRLFKGNAITDDYTALNAAINAVKNYEIGFEIGQYAPYNNIDGLAALAAAKAVDQSVSMFAPDLETIVSNLTNATWIVNTKEENAIYDGDFAIQDEHTTGPTALTGWNNPKGIRQLIKNTETYPGLNSASAKAAVFAWGNTTLTYGNTEGYTMPLAAHTIYELTFKTCGWSDGDMGYVKVTVLNDANEGMAEQTSATATKRITEENQNPWNEFKKYFKTGDAGNYTLEMWTSKHTTFTDIVLKKAVAVDVTISENEDYTPVEKYANVTFERTTVAGWNGMVVPFDVDAAKLNEIKSVFGGDEVKDFSGITYNDSGVTLNFTDANEIKAGRPFMIHLNKAGSSYSTTVTVPNFGEINNPVILSANALEDVSFTAEGYDNIKYTFKGTYAASTDLTDVDFALIQGDTFYYHTAASGNASSAKAFRAYFVNESTEPNAARISFNFGDDVITGISEVKVSTANSDAIYNLGGQRVKKAQKGLYIQNGKKVVVK